MDGQGVKKFSLRARINSATHAWRGLGLAFKDSHNMWAGIVVSALAVYLGFILDISINEWLFLIIAIMLVFITETLNSAMEVDINLTSPQYHPFARDTKDIAAGAVLLSNILAIIVALFIFFPKIYFML